MDVFNFLVTYAAMAPMVAMLVCIAILPFALVAWLISRAFRR